MRRVRSEWRRRSSAAGKHFKGLTDEEDHSLAPAATFFSAVSSTDHCVRTMSSKNIYYSEKYYDDKYEYRHVVLPKEIAKLVPKTHLMSESEWRGLGVQQSHGWVHYLIHEPEPHILLFKRTIQNPPSQEEQFRAEQEQDH